MKYKIYKLVLICISSIPSIISADVFISEIMYDQEGTDSKKEWVEIYNDGPAIDDFTQYKFLENDVFHGIKEYVGGLIFPEKSYVIIADTPASILSSIPEGTIVFDSAFSLSNKGEVVAIANSSKNILDEIFYNTEIGAKGDGKTLQKDGDTWRALVQTPGNGPQGFVDENIQQEDMQQEDVIGQNISIPIYIKEKPIVQNPFTIETLLPERVLKNEVTEFSARAFNSHGDEMIFDNYEWNFGDGSITTGNNVVHTYARSGNFIVFVNGTYNYEYDSDKSIVQVESIPITLNQYEGILEIKNNSVEEFDVSRWTIFVPGNYFNIPEHTYILPRSSLLFGKEELGFEVFGNAQIMTTSGNMIDSYVETEEASEKIIISPIKSTIVSKAKTVSTKEYKEKTDTSNTALVNNAFDSQKKTGVAWEMLLGLIVVFGLGVLYFMQKKTNLIDEIEIID
jgi:hypothetical protein